MSLDGPVTLGTVVTDPLAPPIVNDPNAITFDAPVDFYGPGQIILGKQIWNGDIQVPLGETVTIQGTGSITFAPGTAIGITATAPLPSNPVVNGVFTGITTIQDQLIVNANTTLNAQVWNTAAFFLANMVQVTGNDPINFNNIPIIGLDTDGASIIIGANPALVGSSAFNRRGTELWTGDVNIPLGTNVVVTPIPVPPATPTEWNMESLANASNIFQDTTPLVIIPTITSQPFAVTNPLVLLTKSHDTVSCTVRISVAAIGVSNANPFIFQAVVPVGYRPIIPYYFIVYPFSGNTTGNEISSPSYQYGYLMTVAVNGDITIEFNALASWQLAATPNGGMNVTWPTV